MHDLFEAQVQRSPESIALICDDSQLTYRELDQRANELACYLSAHGVGCGTLVGICTARSLDMVVSMLAIFKAGGAYVPLDPAYPRERLSFVLNDAKLAVVVTQSEYISLFSEQAIDTICMDVDWNTTKQVESSAPAKNVGSENLAYVIYTSGSTGNPKGVMITHASLCNFVRLAGSVLDVTSNDVYMQTASIAYALSVRQLMIPLANGATVILANAEQMRDPLPLFELIKRRGITLMDMVPSFWRTCIYRLGELPEDERKGLLENSLRRIVSIGEALSSDIPHEWVSRFGQQTQLVNIFGQTETTGIVAAYPIPREAPLTTGIVPIGRAIPETRIYILDSKLQPVLAGEQGELCISNPCLASGYLNRPDLTAEKFIANPFNDGLNTQLYRTGDLAVQREDGNIEFIGRGDQQVKIRGQRVELGEVESVIRQHETIRDCTVVRRGDSPDDEHLVAYIVCGDRSPSTHELRQFVRDYLPDYMVPSVFVFLDAMPLTPNGKLNRLALPDPSTLVSKGIDLPSNAEIRTPAEQKLVSIWMDLLNLESVSSHDDFFELGGHSLMVVRLFSRIEEEFGVRLPSTTILQSSTIAALAQKLQQDQTAAIAPVLIPIQTEGTCPPFFCVHGVGGGVHSYRYLAKELPQGQPFYGLQAVNVEDPETCDLSVETMAARYIEAIRSVQPHGPYRVGGYCFGGVVAYEIAQQLEQQGEKVSLLALFEGFLPSIKNRKEPLLKRIRAFWKHIPSWVKDYASMGPDDIRYRMRSTLNKVRAKLQHRQDLQRRARVEEILEMDLSQVPDRYVELTQIHSHALHQYEAHPYSGKLTLFRARNRSFNEVVFGSLDQTMGWSDLARGGVEVRLVDGFHRNIHLPPYIYSLASELKRSLEQEQ